MDTNITIIVTRFAALERVQDALEEDLGECRGADDPLLEDPLENDRGGHVELGRCCRQRLLDLGQHPRDAGVGIFGE